MQTKWFLEQVCFALVGASFDHYILAEILVILPSNPTGLGLISAYPEEALDQKSLQLIRICQ